MVIKDSFRNKILWYKFVYYETVSDYLEGIEWLRINRFKIYGIVCDGFGDLLQALRQYRVTDVSVSSNYDSATLSNT